MIRRRLVRVPRWFGRLAFAFALFSQFAGLALTVQEGLGGRGIGVHIEAVGQGGHYAHDESTCGACQLRAMHARVATPPRLEILTGFGPVAHSVRAIRAPRAERASSNLSRAPPAVI